VLIAKIRAVIQAHQPCGIGILRGRLHLLAKLGAFKEPVQQHHHQRSDDDDDQILRIDEHPVDTHRLCLEYAGQLVGHGAVDQQEHLFEQYRGADGRDHHRQEIARPVAHRLIEQQLEQHAHRAGQHDRGDDREPPR
jgi:hypothetical protein